MLYAKFLGHIMDSMLLCVLSTGSVDSFAVMIGKMKTFEQRKYLHAILTCVTKQHFNSALIQKENRSTEPSVIVSAVAALIHTLVKNSETLRETLVSALTKSSVPALDDSLLARRSVVVAVAQDESQYNTLCTFCTFMTLTCHRSAP
jgi:telomere length regulation protein